jgi:CBS domain-containing protein
MKCSDIMNRNLEWLTEKDSVKTAAKKMAETGLGFLPICDANMRVVGVVTDRDLTVRALAEKVDAETTSATMVMTSPAVGCLASTDVKDAEELMAEERKSRLVVTDANGALSGVISLVDLVEHADGKQALRTVRAVLWRDALGARGGALRGQPLLKDDPAAQNLPEEWRDIKTRPTIFTGGNHGGDTKEFP